MKPYLMKPHSRSSSIKPDCLLTFAMDEKITPFPANQVYGDIRRNRKLSYYLSKKLAKWSLQRRRRSSVRKRSKVSKELQWRRGSTWTSFRSAMARLPSFISGRKIFVVKLFGHFSTEFSLAPSLFFKKSNV